MEAVGRIVLVYVVLGAILQTAGAGEVPLRIAFAATGRFAGGPAHAAILDSGLFGTMSGAAVANVVSTGVFTIPVIKRVGFRPRFAGGIEAAASTGGGIMPPVMGAVAFLMADVTGIPYLHIIVAATIPALMLYGSLFAIVAVEARRNHPDILLITGTTTVTGVLWGCSAFAFSTWGLVTGIGGWEGQRLPVWQRALRIAAGLAVLAVDPRTALPAALTLIAATLVRRSLARTPLTQ